MRHQKFSQRLSRPAGHRRATVRNLVIGLLRYQGIKTTKAKAKFTQQLAERLISLAKEDTLQARRQALRILANRRTVGELFLRIAPLFKTKTSGFTRIIHLSHRRGDGAQMVLLELTQKQAEVKPKEVKLARPEKEAAISEKPEKPKPKVETEEKARFPKKKLEVPKKLKPKQFLGGLRKLFKKERDSL